MADEIVYTDAEHGAMLTNLSHVHHETLGQTVARLEAAIAYAKANFDEFLSPLATQTEVVTREVTVSPAVEVPAAVPTALEPPAVEPVEVLIPPIVG